MSFLFFLLLFILGALIAFHLCLRDPFKILGLAFPFAFGFTTILAFVLDLLGVPITIKSCLLLNGLGACALLFYNFSDLKSSLWKMSEFSIRNSLLSFVNNYWGALGLVGLLAYVLYGISLKAILWPTASYDSIAGFDFVAQVISKEHALSNSIFDSNHYIGSLRSSYPPLIPVNFALAYMAGFEHPKIICVLITLSLSILMCSVVFDATKNWFFALVGTFLLICTPEFLAMSALSLTNVPTALFAGFGLIFIFRFIITSDFIDYKIGTLLLLVGMWTRTEVIIFGLVAIILTAWWSNKKKDYKPLIILSLLVIGSFIIWKLYIDHVLEVDVQQSISFMPFYDDQKLKDVWSLVRMVTMNTQYYGWTVFVFLIFSLSLLFPSKKREDFFLFGVIIITWFLYVMLYYQMNNVNADGDLIKNYITAGYRRGFFSFLPIMVFFIFKTKPILWLSEKLRVV